MGKRSNRIARIGNFWSAECQSLGHCEVKEENFHDPHLLGVRAVRASAHALNRIVILISHRGQ